MNTQPVGRQGFIGRFGVLSSRLLTPQALTVIFLTAGLGLRIFGYVRNPPVWQDEAALALNVIGKGFAELLGPLFFTQAAPPLFLWAERAVVLLLGDSPFALRLLPFLASCAAPLLLLFVARRLLAPAAVPWAVLLFCLNDHLFWHATEAKPYALDVLSATGLMALWCATRGWRLERALLLYAAVAPFIVFLAYPGCFLLGGLMLALLPSLCRERDRFAPWLAFGTLALCVGVSFLLLALGPARAQHDPRIESCWQGLGGFPTWERGSLAVGFWVVKSTVEALSYCCAPIGGALAGVLVLGGVGLWRRGQHATLLFLLAPAALALAASFLGRYPYSGSRVLVFLTPAVVLLLAAGLAPLHDWLRQRSHVAALGLAAIVLVAGGTALAHLVALRGRPAMDRASRYVLSERRAGDLVYGNAWEQRYYFRDLGGDFIPEGPVPMPRAGRVWLVITGADLALREVVLRDLSPVAWEAVQRREFYRTTVLLLRPASRHPSPWVNSRISIAWKTAKAAAGATRPSATAQDRARSAGNCENRQTAASAWTT